MADEKTRVLTASEVAGMAVEPPRFVNGKIVFFCPNGHRLVVSDAHAGKRGRCDKAGCGEAVVIPTRPAAEHAPALAVTPEVSEPPAVEGGSAPHAAADEAAAEPAPPEASSPTGSEPPHEADADQAVAAGEPAVDAGGWQFTSGQGHAVGLDEAAVAADSWQAVAAGEPEGEAFDNPTARLVARLWVERDHGGVVELHLAGGSVILPEWYESRWSRGTHGLFASQAPDGSITLTAVAWEAIQKVVVRQVQGLPDGMFE